MSTQTKKRLAESLKKLMCHSPIHKITVIDLVTDCDINRQTFYYHFQDIYELLGWIYKTEALDSIAHFKTYDTWQTGFLKILHYVETNKSFCLSTFHSLGREHLEGFLNEITFNLLFDVVEELSKGSSLTVAHKRFIARFYCHGFVGLVLDWLKTDLSESPDSLINTLTLLIEGEFLRGIQRLSQ